MNWKRLLMMAVVIGLGVGVYWWKGEGLYRLIRPLPHYQDRLLNSLADLKKLPSPPPVTTNEEDLQTLVERIASLNFPECDQVREQKDAKCDDLKFRQAFHLCLERVEYEVSRIQKIRDKELVPELIKVAEKRKYHYGFLQGKPCEQMKTQFLSLVCAMRFAAIYDLGEIKDARAVDPLLALLDEPPPNFSEPTEGLLESCAVPVGGYISFTCAEALQALLKMDATQAKQGLMPELLQALDDVKEVKDFGPDFYTATRAGCKVGAVSSFGSKGLDSMVEKYQQPGTSEAKKEALLDSISKIRDPKAIPKLKELLHHRELDPTWHGRQADLGYAAAKALAGMALPELIPEYTWMTQNEYYLYVEQGCKALGKIKDPSTVSYLINILKANMGDSLDQGTKTDYASFALAEMGATASEAVPALLDSLNSCDSSCWSIAKALGAMGDEAAVPALLQFVLGNPEGGGGSGRGLGIPWHRFRCGGFEKDR